jgi:teichuronic acid biosynthesis glycosyltransferase TuaC
MPKRSVVLYTQEYPTPNDPTDGIFTEQLAQALTASANVSVVCPMPWWPDSALLRRVSNWVPSTRVPYQTCHGDVTVFYPKVPLVPYFARLPQPLIQACRALPLIRELNRKGLASVINAHSIYPDGVSAAILSSWLKIPLVLTAIGSDINANLSRPLRLKQIRWAMSRASTVVGVSNDLVQKMRALQVPVPVVRIPNGVNRERFFPQDAASQIKTSMTRTLRACGADTRPKLLFVGRLHPVKGLTFLIDALALLKEIGRLEFQTLIVGEGSQERMLRARIERADLERHVFLLGPQPHDEIGDWIRMAKVFCLPSLNEGMPNVVIEAQACGVPVVASNVGGIGELVSADTGILVPPANAAALADALAKAFSRSWDQSLIVRGVAWAHWDESAGNYMELFEASGAQACAD